GLWLWFGLRLRLWLWFKLRLRLRLSLDPSRGHGRRRCRRPPAPERGFDDQHGEIADRGRRDDRIAPEPGHEGADGNGDEEHSLDDAPGAEDASHSGG